MYEVRLYGRCDFLKRKWLDLKGEECRVYTEKDIVLQHISEEDMLELAFEEYKKYNPSNSNMF